MCVYASLQDAIIYIGRRQGGRGRRLVGEIRLAFYHTLVRHQVVNIFFHLSVNYNLHVVELVRDGSRQTLEQLLRLDLLLPIVRHQEADYDVG